MRMDVISASSTKIFLQYEQLQVVIVSGITSHG